MKINAMAGSTIEIERQAYNNNKEYVIRLMMKDGISLRVAYLNEAQAKVFAQEFNATLGIIQELNAKKVVND